MPCPPHPDEAPPRHLDIKQDQGLTVTWADGRVSFYPVTHLRKWSPSADARELRDQLASNPLTVLPAKTVSSDKPLTIEAAQRVGNYASRLVFSDGHDTGIYSWRYLRQIEPQAPCGPLSDAPSDARSAARSAAPPSGPPPHA
jgi:DUF971 family protein